MCYNSGEKYQPHKSYLRLWQFQEELKIADQSEKLIMETTDTTKATSG
jgi:hypothetical protein